MALPEWHDVEGYEGIYQVSNHGQVKSLGNGKYKKEKILKAGKRAGEYKFVVLCKMGNGHSVSVHRLVARAFLPNPQNLPEVNHKDESPANNAVENLEWCSCQYNIDYSKSKRVEQYTVGGEKVAEYKSIAYAAKITGISRTAINNNLTNWTKTSGGYIWKYICE